MTTHQMVAMVGLIAWTFVWCAFLLYKTYQAHQENILEIPKGRIKQPPSREGMIVLFVQEDGTKVPCIYIGETPRRIVLGEIYQEGAVSNETAE